MEPFKHPANFFDLLRQITLLTDPVRSAIEFGHGEEAVTLAEQKHNLILQAFGKRAPSTGTSLIDLARAYFLAGRLKNARSALEEAFQIYQDHERFDKNMDLLEQVLKEVCAQQGHYWIVEQVARRRISRFANLGASRDFDRAVEQDGLAMLLERMRRPPGEALDLAKNSLSIFEKEQGQEGEDTGVCCLFLARIYKQMEDFAEAAAYGRRALKCAETCNGGGSEKASIAADELAVSLAFCADKEENQSLAREAIDLSQKAHDFFLRTNGATHKTTIRSAGNRTKLLQMLARFGGHGVLPTHRVDPRAPVENADLLPTYCFISHSYSDDKALKALLEILPEYVQPVVFDPIKVAVHEFVSEKLVSGILGAEGLVFIDSVESNRSFWCAFERDLALRSGKRVFAFNPQARSISLYERKPPRLLLAHLHHSDDDADVRFVVRWLVEERSFEVFHDPVRLGDQSAPPMAVLDEHVRDLTLCSMRSFGASYMLFVSKTLLESQELATHAISQANNHASSTMVCWLDPPDSIPASAPKEHLQQFRPEASFSFSARPRSPTFRTNELDSLMVRLFWVYHETST